MSKLASLTELKRTTAQPSALVAHFFDFGNVETAEEAPHSKPTLKLY